MCLYMLVWVKYVDRRWVALAYGWCLEENKMYKSRLWCCLAPGGVVIHHDGAESLKNKNLLQFVASAIKMDKGFNIIKEICIIATCCIVATQQDRP